LLLPAKISSSNVLFEFSFPSSQLVQLSQRDIGDMVMRNLLVVMFEAAAESVQVSDGPEPALAGDKEVSCSVYSQNYGMKQSILLYTLAQFVQGGQIELSPLTI